MLLNGSFDTVLGGGIELQGEGVVTVLGGGGDFIRCGGSSGRKQWA